jgi:hypothetical protein
MIGQCSYSIERLPNGLRFVDVWLRFPPPNLQRNITLLFNSCVETASCGVFVTREIYTLKFLVLSTRDLLGVISLYRQ